MPDHSRSRPDSGSRPEDLFAELFAQVCGLEKAGLLVPQYPVEDAVSHKCSKINKSDCMDVELAGIIPVRQDCGRGSGK
jgi:hypothetical protein